ncbi:MAG: Asp-tRNA(Asn)/Glu-tRNA(Gln) amidotransferase subunit GatC [Calditrichota bacterium]
MSVTKEQVEHIAKLARLVFDETEKDRLATELSAVLDYVEQLQSVNTQGVEPLSHPNDIANRLRADNVGESLSQEAALQNAPAKEKGFFKVPKVIK